MKEPGKLTIPMARARRFSHQAHLTKVDSKKESVMVKALSTLLMVVSISASGLTRNELDWA